MLAELRIVNFALIEQLSLQFQSGFTVLTGETGAGKSLLIDAIALLVGGRASTDQIRSEKTRPSLKQPSTSQTPIHSFNACGYTKSSVRTSLS